MRKIKCSTWLFSLLILLGGGGIMMATLLGYFSKPRPWSVATGWDLIPTSLKPKFYEPSFGDPRIFWLGHAGFLIQWDGVSLLLDPNLDEKAAFVPRWMENSIKPEDLPPIDACLISHSHYDHLNNFTLQGISGLTEILIPDGSQRYVELPFGSKTKIRGVDIGNSIKIGSLEIIPVKARHGGGRGHPFPGSRFAVGYVIGNGEKRIYYSGDTAFGDHFGQIAEKYHPVIGIFPIGGYSPRIPLKYHHLNPSDVIRVAKEMKIGLVIPSHFGTFRVAFDHPSTALLKFSGLAHENKINWAMPQMATKDNLLEEEKNVTNSK